MSTAEIIGDETGLADPARFMEEAAASIAAAHRILDLGKAGVRAIVEEAGSDIDSVQHAMHGLAWLATTVEGLRQLHAWAQKLRSEGRFSDIEELITRTGFAEYLSQIAGGIPMSQLEMIRPAELGIPRADVRAFEDATANLIATGSTAQVKARLAQLISDAKGATTYGDSGLDEMYAEIHEQMRRFSQAEVVPHAHEWHLANDYIPMEIIEKVAELGVFGLTIPEELGGLGLGKEAMCVVSEELSRGYIGVGSLGTRAEIAGELILHNGTEEQKQKYLPKISAGEILPTAVFTEPNVGSDLASLKTRGVKDGDVYRVTGQKTWITHPVRADLMTLLVRTNPDEKGYRGLSMLLVDKPRGNDANPFPAEGMTGGEIEVLGYRGMKEYDISFDDFTVPESQLLGGAEGQGFKQLMNTFEGARIQTAARAVGVAQCAMDLALGYALD
ncbi:MAG: acyl-CoA dehydrogenase, partial [Alphaproteobacteria bacterium BRH_c36]